MPNLKFLLPLILLSTIGTIEAQQPPMPPMPPMLTAPVMIVRVNPDSTNTFPKAHHTHLITNIFEIPCREYFYWATTHTGEMVYLGKLCPQDALTNTSWSAYRLILRSTNFTVLQVFANNPVPPPPSAIIPISPPLPPPPPSLKTSAVMPMPPTWTNNPNLRLTITRTSGTTCVTFPTETNKLYECQATDNAGQSWLGSLKIVGTGKSVTQCDTTTHSSRLYRVSETSALKAGAAATVIPDPIPPTLTLDDIISANITNFPHDVLFRYILGTGNGNQWWTDPENTNLNTGKIFDVVFPSKSNEFVLPFSTTNLNFAWRGFPIETNLRPSRSSMTQGLFFPIYPTGMRFFTIRSSPGTNRVTWNL
jgi:hypothetical protein